MKIFPIGFIHFYIYLIMLMGAIVCFTPLSAQTAIALGLKPHGLYNTTTAGILLGDASGSSFQTVIGYRFRYRFHAGAGAGIDGFTGVRTVPLFAAFSADLSRRKTTPFGFVHAGAAFPWMNESQYPFGRRPEKNTAGPYLQAGVGQKIRLGGNASLQLSLGYTLAKEQVVYAPFNTTKDTYTNRYSFRRLTIQFGFTL